VRKISDHSLYLVISEECGSGRSAIDIAKMAIAGGVDIIQMREKNKAGEELAVLGRRLSAACKKSGVLFIVNDDPVLAAGLGADGVHLGQEDMKKYPLTKARSVIGEDKIIGVSTHSFEEFKIANEEDCDYIAFGPVFPTKTKDYFIGTEAVKDVSGIARKPVFFIGGIGLSNIDGLLMKGARNIALIRGITEAEDIAAMTARFKEKLRSKRKARKMRIRINGKEEAVDDISSIAELVSIKNLSCDRIVIEHNSRILPKEEWPGAAIRENDVIEIVSFVGGG